MTEPFLIDYKRSVKIPVTLGRKGSKLTLRFPFNMTVKDRVRGCAGAQWDPEEKQWVVDDPSISFRNGVVLGHLSKGTIPNTILDPFRRLGKVEDCDYNSLPYFQTFRNYQKDIYPKVFSSRRYLLGYDMGLGKTLIMIQLMNHLYNIHKKDLRFGTNLFGTPFADWFWVIAPLSPLRAWRSELTKWDSLVKPKLISCDQSKIARAIEEAKYPPLCLILDESSKFRNAGAKRTDYLIQLSYMMNKHWEFNESVVGLTGTPAPKDPTGFHSQFEIIMPGLLKEKNASNLKRELANVEWVEGPHGKYPVTKGWKVDKVKEFNKRISIIFDAKFKKDCLELPERIFEDISADVTAETLGICRSIIETSESALIARMRLRQFSDGFVKVDDDNFELIPNSPKQLILRDELEVLKSNDINRIIIYAAFKKSIDIITNVSMNCGYNVIRLDGRGMQAFSLNDYSIKAEVEQFENRDKDVPIIWIANPKSGGMGLTLVAAEHMYFYSNTNDPEDRTQAMDRNYRIGSRGSIVKDIFYLPTDRIIRDTLKMKRNLELLSMGDMLTGLQEMELSLG